MVVLTIALLHVQAAAGLVCSDETAQLFPVDVQLLSASGSVIYSSSSTATTSLDTDTAAAKICATYPVEADADHWGDFVSLSTVQFVIPPSVAPEQIAQVQFISSSGRPFTLLSQGTNKSSGSTGAAVSYPAEGAATGSPVHATLFLNDPTTLLPVVGMAMAVWVSFSKPSSFDCARYGHCCTVSANSSNAATTVTKTTASCSLQPPRWQCMSAQGVPWVPNPEAPSFSSAKAKIKSINYIGSLVSPSMADGKPVLIHFEAGARLAYPLTTSYAEHPVVNSAACTKLCSNIEKANRNSEPFDMHTDAHAAKCKLSSLSGPNRGANFKAKSGFGPITVNGFGTVDGKAMMEAFDFEGKVVWSNAFGGAGAAVLNGYGNQAPHFQTIADAEAHTRWRINSGLVELSSAAAPTAGFPFAVDVSEVTVGWGAKRGDGAVRLQFERVPLDGAGETAQSNNQPAKLYDVKTPGTWVGASDGPRVTADGSEMGFLYLHHSDDNLKIDSSRGWYHHITLVQGNIGSAIELGTYGIGIRENSVRDAHARGIYIHRIEQGDSQDDNLGSVLGSRTCPWGITLDNITIEQVTISPPHFGNNITAIFNIGTLGAPDGDKFKPLSALDRWFFCSNAWWLDNNTIVGKRSVNNNLPAVSMSNLVFKDWSVGTKPTHRSELYDFHPEAHTVFTNLTVTVHKIATLSNLTGVHLL